MRVVFSASPSAPVTPRYEGAAVVPIRQAIAAPDGTVHRIPIDTSAPDAHTIIGAIQFVIEQFGRDPRVRDVATSVLVSRLDNDLERHASALTRWVKSRMRYLPDPDGAEYVQTPIILLDRIRNDGFAYGDCDDHVALLGALMMSVGIPARAAAVKLHGSEWYNHVVVEYSDRMGRVRLVDPCAKNGETPVYRDRLVAG